MKIGIISGSHRQDSQSEKVARYLAARIVSLDHDSWLYSLAGNPLPFWDEGVFDKTEDWEERLAPLRQNLGACDGFVIVAPEWHGMVPAGLKNLLLLLDKSIVGHKPSLLTAVSASAGGAYPIAELRASSYKNNRICHIPEHLIVRQVGKVLNEDPADNDERSDSFIRLRIDWALQILFGYAEALAAMRASHPIEYGKFANGM